MTAIRATIEAFSWTSGGTALTDAGQRVEFPAGAARAGGWRTLRSGQRIELDVIDGVVTRVRLWTVRTP